MSKQFLVVVKKTVVDQPFVAAQPEVPAVMDDTVDPPVEVTPAIPAVPEQPLITHEEVERCYIETDAAAVAKVKAAQADDPEAHADLEIWSLKFNTALRPNVRRVRIRSRAPVANVPEEVTIEDQDGDDLGVGRV